MEFLKIIAGCILAAIVYGIVHDQITARICIQYFTVFHPPVFPTQSPTLLGIGWGILATWWVGAILGILLALAARLGSRRRFSAADLAPMIGALLLVMGICAATFGTIGYFTGTMPAAFSGMLPVEFHRRFLADWWAHTASYASGFMGGITLCAIVLLRRLRSSES